MRIETATPYSAAKFAVACALWLHCQALINSINVTIVTGSLMIAEIFQGTISLWTINKESNLEPQE